METIWRWFYRTVVGVGVTFAALSVIFVVGMSRPNVRESNGYTDITPNAIAATISQSLPESATEIRHCQSSVGLGGRLLMYRFSAALADLHEHAETEFSAHWDKPTLEKSPNSPSPFAPDDLERIESAFGVDADWMLAPGALGTVYASADGRWSHRPIIFVDDANHVLYFQMTD